MKINLKIAVISTLLSLAIVACSSSNQNNNTPEMLPTPTPPPPKQFVTPTTDDVRGVSSAALIKYKAWESGSFDDFYNDLHPDSQTAISKDDFVKYWTEKRKSMAAKNPELRDIKFIQSEKLAGFDKTYTNIAEVIVTFKYEIGGKEVTTQDGINYLVKDNSGKWLFLWKK